MTYVADARWCNHRRNHCVTPPRTYTPKTLEEVRKALRDATSDGVSVRAVGSGHSWSDVAVPGGYLIRPQGMTSSLDLEADLLHDPRPTDLVRVEAGMRIRDLNRLLADRGQALINMGGYDGQTVAGVISTSTHGSGGDFGPLNDFVRSIDLVLADGVLCRIEPDDGPTDEAKWRARYPSPDHELLKDNTAFRAAVVGMGCMGIVYSAIVAVQPAFLLTEKRTPSTWEDESEGIRDGIAGHRHYELLLTPYPRKDGKHQCMVTTRHPHEGERPPWWSRRARRNLFAETVSGFPGAGRALQLFAKLFPSRIPGTLRWVLNRLTDDEYTGPSYRVFNIGPANALPAMSMEIGVAVDGTHVEAMKRVFAVAADFRENSIYHSAPIALRFVKGSPASMSMMHGRELTMMIELIVLAGTSGSLELLAAYEDALYPLAGRPHWGQVNHLTRERIEKLYPGADEFGAWLRVREQLDPSSLFRSPFSERVGITGALA